MHLGSNLLYSILKCDSNKKKKSMLNVHTETQCQKKKRCMLKQLWK